MYWNPFAHLWETQKYPSSRLLRSSLWERFKDTFKVFYGSFLNCDMGIVDYLFPLPRLFQNSCHALDKMKPEDSLSQSLVKGVLITSVILTFLFSLPKFLIATVAATILMPMIIPIHYIIREVNPWLKDILKLQLQEVSVCKKEGVEKIIFNNTQRYLMQRMEIFVDTDTQDLEDIREDEFYVKPIYKLTSNENIPEFSSSSHYSSSSGYGELLLGVFCKEPYSCFSPANVGLPRGIISFIPENKAAIQAILKTNCFQATTQLESDHLLEAVENRLK